MVADRKRSFIVYRRGRAFTLAELLTVLAIMAIMAGLLFPAFLSAKSAAKGSVCLSNMRQAWAAANMYIDDYDQYFMPVNHRPGAFPNPKLDRTWVQLVLPYARVLPHGRSFEIFTCPADTSLWEGPDTAFDQDLVPGDVYARYYTASMHVNMGFNYLYLSPIIARDGKWVSVPKSTMSVSDPSRTLLFVDSIWDRTKDGAPIDGGSWLVVPPCRFEEEGTRRVDTFAPDGTVYTPFVGGGWHVDQPNSPHIYGNAWPWHNGHVNLVRVDGSVKSVPIGLLTAGCDVQESWNGLIDDPSAYMWDLR